MNTSRIITAVRDIERYQAALEWLQKYGTGIKGREEATASVKLIFAASCTGATEAAETLSAYATLALPELVQTAIRSCENTIAICRDAIREEASS